ncbi:glycosyltransferase [Stenotrophomonas sp. HMSC10F06]|uniref:glycosyltransferase n=1 Tax=Stenotrophomonas sp. HMSC10F06 TaxID=1581081 RepID=UPI001586D268|nr:glycosyltransferase [Stenotrophomonas sp. HMSC10F06]
MSCQAVGFAQVSVVHAAETIRGGVATILRQLLEHQRSSGRYRVHCVVPQDQRDDLENLSADVSTFRRTGRNAVSLLCFGIAFVVAVWRTNPDIVHLHSTFAGFIGRLMLVPLWPWRRPSVVYCPHAFAFLMPSGMWKTRAYALAERALQLLTDAVVCISRYEHDTAVEKGLDPATLHVILNGVQAMQAPPGGTTDPFPPDALKVLFVGRFDRQKGFDVLIDAMSQLEGCGVHLIAVGGGVLEADAVHRPAAANVEFAGWHDRQGISRYLAYADVLVVPSRWEGFGLVVVEAASVGVPTLGSRTCSLPEIVQDGIGGLLFEEGSSSELARLLRSTPRERWARMGHNARVNYQSAFTSLRMNTEVEVIYAKIIRSA